MPRETGERVVARNRRALHDYTIGERLEAGLVLTGTEVKSLRDGHASLADAFATIDDGEVWLHQANIPEYSMGSWRRSHTALRKRKLLLHRKEIARLERQLDAPGRTLVPLSLYFKDGRAKVELAVGTGKREWDKRQAIRERDMNREAQRELAERTRRKR
ncbi:SsrA-binding protein SmpB [Propionibacterium australiense]|uniref:SsrA-binding protein n=1 Tax=Propionibacterium australiense TaxID=119981 RepID=A0A383S510_9ACTN|nr:SsrA-binding protein SmpB [Propionibacterium australiense]RLP08906.1 SsrA-binding protein SmpB [Propionibacterium australiense]RLP11717.1 SsrA-binding protein SmpB [Propionibacterium australiense]SYZ32459.1 SmpB [Propionibacterium australiense]VEH90169.1 SsrA-binding protein [Propionibacterium australiense]